MLVIWGDFLTIFYGHTGLIGSTILTLNYRGFMSHSLERTRRNLPSFTPTLFSKNVYQFP